MNFHMTKKTIAEDQREFEKIVVWWNEGNDELTVRNRTMQEAYEMALAAGYRPPVWYKPWQYLTGGLGMMTVGFGQMRMY